MLGPGWVGAVATVGIVGIVGTPFDAPWARILANASWSNGHLPAGFCGGGSAFCGVVPISRSVLRGTGGEAVAAEPTDDELSAFVYLAGTVMPHGRLGDSPSLTSLRGRSKWLVLSSSATGSCGMSSGGDATPCKLSETALAHFVTLVSFASVFAFGLPSCSGSSSIASSGSSGSQA